MNHGSMALKRYSAFLKTPALLEPHHQIRVGVPYHFAEMQSVYSTAPAYWAFAVVE